MSWNRLPKGLFSTAWELVQTRYVTQIVLTTATQDTFLSCWFALFCPDVGVIGAAVPITNTPDSSTTATQHIPHNNLWLDELTLFGNGAVAAARTRCPHTPENGNL